SAAGGGSDRRGAAAVLGRAVAALAPCACAARGAAACVRLLGRLRGPGLVAARSHRRGGAGLVLGAHVATRRTDADRGATAGGGSRSAAVPVVAAAARAPRAGPPYASASIQPG